LTKLSEETFTRTLLLKTIPDRSMNSTGKVFTLFFVLIMAISSLSLLMVKPANAESISKPLVPEFTLKVVASSIEVTIKNQPLTAYENGSYPNLYYGFRFKDHENIQNWNYAPIYYVGISSYGTYYNASASDYTAVPFPLRSYPLTGILDSGRIDLQVMALIGNEVPTNYENGSVYAFDGAESNWSTTHTISTLSYSDSPTPTVPELSLFVILSLLIFVLLVAMVASHRKTANLKHYLFQSGLI
jgi:hypothetical protein